MKESKSINTMISKGTGYIIGAAIGIVAAITAFIFTENLAISIPLFAGLSIPLGMIIEQKFHTKEKGPHVKRLLITLSAIGVLLLLSLIFITKIV